MKQRGLPKISKPWVLLLDLQLTNCVAFTKSLPLYTSIFSSVIRRYYLLNAIVRIMEDSWYESSLLKCKFYISYFVSSKMLQLT